MKVLFWDIDGTLIRTAKAGLFALNEATNYLYNKEADFSKITTGGMTDTLIASQIIEQVTGRKATSDEVLQMTKYYEEVLPLHIISKQGSVMPRIQEILEKTSCMRDYTCLLLTGNSHKGAQIKLNHYKLAHYFDFNKSAFCDDCSDRNEISSKALRIAKGEYPNIQDTEMYVIGDTPNDISCGKYIGARTIAVATGNYSKEELEGYSPWWSVEELPDVDEFMKKLSEK